MGFHKAIHSAIKSTSKQKAKDSYYSSKSNQVPASTGSKPVLGRKHKKGK